MLVTDSPEGADRRLHLAIRGRSGVGKTLLLSKIVLPCFGDLVCETGDPGADGHWLFTDATERSQVFIMDDTAIKKLIGRKCAAQGETMRKLLQGLMNEGSSVAIPKKGNRDNVLLRHRRIVLIMTNDDEDTLFKPFEVPATPTETDEGSGGLPSLCLLMNRENALRNLTFLVIS